MQTSSSNSHSFALAAEEGATTELAAHDDHNDNVNDLEEQQEEETGSLAKIWGAVRNVIGFDKDTIVNAGALPHRPVSVTQPPATTKHQKQSNDHDNDDNKFADIPFLQHFAQHQGSRNQFLDESGGRQAHCPKSTSGWVRTLFVWEGRALDWVYLPFAVVVLHAVLYVCLDQYIFHFDESSESTEWQSIFTFALNSTLGFLLVFRLNRASIRYWFARELWGRMLVAVRTMTTNLLIHHGGTKNENKRRHRDNALRWLAAYPMSTCHYIRGEVEIPRPPYAGILSDTELDLVEQRGKPVWPLFVAVRLQRHLYALYSTSSSTSNNDVKNSDSNNDNNNSILVAEKAVSKSILRTQQLQSMEALVDRMLGITAAMERVRSTPLPIAYVSHMRTFILINLLLIPWVWGPDWGWWTIGVVAVVAFAFLGIEAASAEVEIPFRKDRANALDMDGYCKGMLGNMQQIMVNYYYDSSDDDNLHDAPLQNPKEEDTKDQ